MSRWKGDLLTYQMNWAPLQKVGAICANLAVLYGKNSRLIGIDCDTPDMVNLVKQLVGETTYILGHRGVTALLRNDMEVSQQTADMGNPWCYESVRALSQELSPKTFSRALSKLVKIGFLQEAPNDLESTRAKRLTAQKKYRCSEVAMKLTWESRNPDGQTA